MHPLISILVGFLAFVLMGVGFWLLFFAKDMRMSSDLKRVVILGFFLAAIVRIFSEPEEYTFRPWARRLLGLFFVFSGAALLFLLWNFGKYGQILL